MIDDGKRGVGEPGSFAAHALIDGADIEQHLKRIERAGFEVAKRLPHVLGRDPHRGDVVTRSLHRENLVRSLASQLVSDVRAVLLGHGS